MSGFFCACKIAMPASAGPPSFALKNLICVAFGLPSWIVQATTEPALGAFISVVFVATLTWKPVVRLTARHGLAGQLGVVSGVVGGITPTSVIVAPARLGMASSSAKLARMAVYVRFIIANSTRVGTGCSALTFRYPLVSSCAAAAIS